MLKSFIRAYTFVCLHTLCCINDGNHGNKLHLCTQQLNTTSVQPICQHCSLSRNDVILSIMEPELAQHHTHTQTQWPAQAPVPLAPGDRCDTAAWQEPGDPSRQPERPVSQLTGWFTDRKGKSSLTISPADWCKDGKKNRVNVSPSFYTQTRVEMLKHTPRCKLDTVCLLPSAPQTKAGPETSVHPAVSEDTIGQSHFLWRTTLEC